MTLAELIGVGSTVVPGLKPDSREGLPVRSRQGDVDLDINRVTFFAANAAEYNEIRLGRYFSKATFPQTLTGRACGCVKSSGGGDK